MLRPLALQYFARFRERVARFIRLCMGTQSISQRFRILIWMMDLFLYVLVFNITSIHWRQKPYFCAIIRTRALHLRFGGLFLQLLRHCWLLEPIIAFVRNGFLACAHYQPIATLVRSVEWCNNGNESVPAAKTRQSSDFFFTLPKRFEGQWQIIAFKNLQNCEIK